MTGITESLYLNIRVFKIIILDIHILLFFLNRSILSMDEFYVEV